MDLKIRVIDISNWDYKIFDTPRECIEFFHITLCDLYKLLSLGKRCLFQQHGIKYYFEYDDPRNESIAYKEQRENIYEKCMACEKLHLNTFSCCIPCYIQLL